MYDDQINHATYLFGEWPKNKQLCMMLIPPVQMYLYIPHEISNIFYLCNNFTF